VCGRALVGCVWGAGFGRYWVVFVCPFGAHIWVLPLLNRIYENVIASIRQEAKQERAIKRHKKAQQKIKEFEVIKYEFIDTPSAYCSHNFLLISIYKCVGCVCVCDVS
jgi:hypothetical protein